VHPENRRIPTLFSAARGCAEAREQAIRAGCIDFLPEPFGEEGFMHALQKVLTRKTNVS
jgi:CheY-like chemotaxis protein